MDVIDTLATRNDEFARSHFAPGMPVLPRLRTLVLTCVDPRLDPAHIADQRATRRQKPCRPESLVE
jgi:carbonic anhydrase